MLSEEALLLLVALGACALLILGVLELVWPTRSRHPVRRPSLPPPVAPPPPALPPEGAAEPAPEPPPRTAGERARRRSTREARMRARTRLYARRGDAAGTEAAPEPALEGVEPEEAGLEAEPAEIASDAGPSETLPLERCFALYQDRRFADVISEGASALRRSGAEAPPAETAALWSIVGLARQALGDHEGARAALEAAVEAAPEADRPTYRRHVGALALNVAQSLLARARSHPNPESDERVRAIRAARAWLARGRAATPADPALRATEEEVEGALWPAYEQVIMALVQRQEFRGGRRLLREALEDETIPEDRADDFRELLLGTFSGEIGQLTAQAIRSMQEARESEALAALQRAEELLATVPEEALPPKRREEVDRRLWWGYTTLGVRRVEAGEFDDAPAPLLHALRFTSIGPDRQAETRSALVRALEGVAETHALTIRQLADEGDVEAATVETDRLWSLLRQGIEAGLSEDELSVAYTTTQRVAEEVRRGRE